MSKHRDIYTIDMFTGSTIETIPMATPVVPKPKKKSATSSVPRIPLSPEITGLKQALPKIAAPASQSVHDLTLFPQPYLIVLIMALAMIFIIIADSLYDIGITGNAIAHKAHLPGRLDQYLLALARGIVAATVVLFTLCCGVHIAVRQTPLPLLRYVIAGFFILTALTLLTLTAICEIDYMRVGIADVLRRLENIRAMKW